MAEPASSAATMSLLESTDVFDLAGLLYTHTHTSLSSIEALPQDKHCMILARLPLPQTNLDLYSSPGCLRPPPTNFTAG